MAAFKVLMWKHYTVRKRRFFQTFIELISPILITFVIFLLKDQMMSKAQKTILRNGAEEIQTQVETILYQMYSFRLVRKLDISGSPTIGMYASIFDMSPSKTESRPLPPQV